MSFTIFNGDITIYEKSDINGDKQIRWTKAPEAGFTTYNIRDFYSALMDSFSQAANIDLGLPIKAITKTEFEFGLIEANDLDPWYIDPEVISHLSGGSLQTKGWERIENTNNGIIEITVTNNTFTPEDVGYSISHTSGSDTGILLYTTNDKIIIRPNSNASTDSFNYGTGQIMGGLYGVSTADCVNISPFYKTGEQLYSNIKSIGNISGNEQIYIYQGNKLLPITWDLGHIDILIPIYYNDITSKIINEGNVSIFARKPGQKFDNFTINLSSGGRSIIPIQSSEDIETSNVEVLANGITINERSSEGFATSDISSTIADENFVIEIDCANNPLSYVYNYIKWQMSQEGSLQLYGRDFRAFQGISAMVNFDTVSGNINLGDIFYAQNSLSENTSSVMQLLAYSSTEKWAIIGNMEGNLDNTYKLVSELGSLENITNISYYSYNKDTPFGTFSDNKFTGAPGILLTNVNNLDNNNYTLYSVTDSLTSIEPPLMVSYSISGLKDNTEVRIFKDSDSTEIAGAEEISNGVGTSITPGVSISGTTDSNVFSYSYTYSGDTEVFIAIVNKRYNNIILKNITLSDTNSSIPVSQVLDRAYVNP